jgi:predicted nucleotidyltransferase
VSAILDSSIIESVFPHPYRLLFVTISGAHLYGFPSPDSDYDLRGVHILPAAEVVGLDSGPETIENSAIHEGMEIDLVAHDAKKFFLLLLKKNGYVLEQLHSPLIVRTSPEHEELKSIARGCVTRHHSYHYLHFASGQWHLLEKKPTVKALLYVYRVLLTGIHLMQSGEIEANLVKLHARFNHFLKLPYIPELIHRKTTAREKSPLPKSEFAFHQKEFTRLHSALELAAQSTTLPDQPSTRPQLHDLLLRLRLKNPSST